MSELFNVFVVMWGAMLVISSAFYLWAEFRVEGWKVLERIDRFALAILIVWMVLAIDVLKKWGWIL